MKKTILKIVISLLVIVISNINAQEKFEPISLQCGGSIQPPIVDNLSKAASNCSASSSAYINKYRLPGTYIPTPSDPVITLKVTFHIFNDASGNGSWPNSQIGINDLNTIAGWLKNGYSRYSAQRLANYSPPGFISPYINDMRIEYEVTNIYFYNDNTLNTSMNDGVIFSHISSVDPNRLEEGLPIIFNSGSFPGAAGYQGSYNGVPYVHTFIVAPPMGLWWCQAHLRHEIAHCFGLLHLYGLGSCCPETLDCSHIDYLHDAIPINNPFCPTSGPGAAVAPCFNCHEGASNMQSNNVVSGYMQNTEWTSPIQMGRIRRAMHMNSIRKFAKKMISDINKPWIVSNNEVWDFDFQVYQDIVVKAGSTLTIKCKLGMANNGRIIVEPKAKLVLDGGEINAWGDSWLGVQVWGNSAKQQKIVNGLSPFQGIVQVINQGTIRDAVYGITTAKYDENVNIDWGGYFGGIVQCDNARFINNMVAMQYFSYKNINPITNTIQDDLGYFYNSLFETNALHKDVNIPYPQTFISMWDVKGIKFHGNTYQNTISPLPPIDKRGLGIYSIDASYSVDRFKVCAVVDPITGNCLQYSTNNLSQFKNLHYGVKVSNSIPFGSIIINDNDFVGCNRSIYISGTYNTGINFNRIDVGAGISNNSFLPYGIYLENSSAYSVSNNKIHSTTYSNYNSSIATGICVNGSNGLNNTIYRNEVNLMGVGTSVFGDNQGVNPGDGLKFICNNFGQGALGKNRTDLYMAYSNTLNINGKIDMMQGSSIKGANNTFSHTGVLTPGFNSDYYDGGGVNTNNPNNSVQYYYNTGNSNLVPWYYDPSINPQAVNINYTTNMCPVNQSSGGGGSGSKIVSSKMNVEKTITEDAIRIINKQLNEKSVFLDHVSNKDNEQANKLVSEIVDLKAEHSIALNNAIRLAFGDTIIGVDKDKVISLIKSASNLSDDKLLSIYISFDKIQEARSLLAEMKRRSKQSNEYKLYELLIFLKEDISNINKIKSDIKVKNALEEIGKSDNPNSSYARSILQHVFHSKFEETINLPPTYKSLEDRISLLSNVAFNNDDFQIHPNPTDRFVIIDKISTSLNVLKVIVKDLNNKIIQIKEFSDESKEWKIDLEDLVNGTYILSIVTDKSIFNKKLIVNK